MFLKKFWKKKKKKKKKKMGRYSDTDVLKIATFFYSKGDNLRIQTLPMNLG